MFITIFLAEKRFFRKNMPIIVIISTWFASPKKKIDSHLFRIVMLTNQMFIALERGTRSQIFGSVGCAVANPPYETATKFQNPCEFGLPQAQTSQQLAVPDSEEKPQSPL